MVSISQNFKPLAGICNAEGKFMSYLVEKNNTIKSNVLFLLLLFFIFDQRNIFRPILPLK